MNYFVSNLSRKMRKQIRSIPEQVMEILTNCPWKGNVRELANLIERAVILSHGEELQVPMAELLVPCTASESALTGTFQEAEREVIIEALRAASGRIAETGELPHGLD